MLQFLRRHQHYFFIVITIVVVISFSFFGTQGTFEHPSSGDRVVSQAVDGSNVRHSDIEEMALFLGSDTFDKLLSGGEWGPNFLNDGVIANDFLKTGLAAELVQAYPNGPTAELQQRLDRERRAVFYVHPTAPFISAQAAWSYFAPQVASTVTDLRLSKDAAAPAAFDLRAQLYLAERAFPALALRQVLQYQEQQYQWITPDPQLERADLSLFGYHTLEDWFGPSFVRLVSQFVINAAKIAERKGYKVTRDEAAADLFRQAELSYGQLKKLPSLGVTSPDQYLRMQLRRMGMDESRAVAVWRQVLLFRRLFHGAGDAIFVDALPFSEFNEYAMQQADGTMYQLPKAIWLSNYRALQRFQIYLTTIAKGRLESPVAVPNQFVTAQELLKSHPELVQKRYLLGITEVSAKTLQGGISLKEMWNWQVQDTHWAQLQKDFPELGAKAAKTVTERLDALDALNSTTRSRLNAATRKAIVAEHPDWLATAFEDASENIVTVGIRLKGGNLPVSGVENREAFIALLDKASVGGEPSAELQRFTGDGQSFYRIRVLDRSKDWEILTYGEATEDNTLDDLAVAVLEPYYLKVRETAPDQFRKSDGSWRTLNEVRDAVADLYFKDLLTILESEAKKAQGGGQQAFAKNTLAGYRFYAYMRSIRDRFKTSPTEEAAWLYTEAATKADALPAAKSIANQFKLTKHSQVISRADGLVQNNQEGLFALPLWDWTDIMVRPSGDVWFFQVTAKKTADTAPATRRQIVVARDLLADDAERLLMRHILKEIKDKDAINLMNGREV